MPTKWTMPGCLRHFAWGFVVFLLTICRCLYEHFEGILRANVYVPRDKDNYNNKNNTLGNKVLAAWHMTIRHACQMEWRISRLDEFRAGWPTMRAILSHTNALRSTAHNTSIDTIPGASGDNNSRRDKALARRQRHKRTQREILALMTRTI